METSGNVKDSNSRMSVDDVLRQYNGIGPGFDALRIALAIIILYVHCYTISSGEGPAHLTHSMEQSMNATNITDAPKGWGSAIWSTLHRVRLILVLNHSDAHFNDTLVPMFFALSGFLVTGSAFRTRSIRPFLVFRCLRILPALCTEVTLSALILGPLLTTFTISEYFSDPKFYAYFGNIVGRVRFELPGLFLNNPLPERVNGNLWTLPAEFYCYLIIAVAIVSGVLYSRLISTLLFSMATCVVVITSLYFGFVENATNTPLAIFYFFCGSLAYHWREHLPFNRWIFVASLLITYFHFIGRSNILLYPMVLTYATIYLGLIKFPKIPIVQRGDYSYGVYLYGFPIAQALVATVPHFRDRGIWLFVVAAPVTIAFAMFSWHLIERPTLSLKRYFGSREARVTSVLIGQELKRERRLSEVNTAVDPAAADDNQRGVAVSAERQSPR